MGKSDFTIGDSINLSLQGQALEGTITSVGPGALEVTFPLRQAAGEALATQGFAQLPDGSRVAVDLTKNAHFERLVLRIPVDDKAAPAAPGAERRRFFRLGIELPVELIDTKLQGPGVVQEIIRATGTTFNLSGGGMLVALDAPLKAGVYDFLLHLPLEPMRLKGRVVRAGLGAQKLPIEFVDLPERERGRLIRYIFAKMRNAKEGHENLASNSPGEAKPRYLLRREKYLPPMKPRYW
jgi:hypothetical protein